MKKILNTQTATAFIIGAAIATGTTYYMLEKKAKRDRDIKYVQPILNEMIMDENPSFNINAEYIAKEWNKLGIQNPGLLKIKEYISKNEVEFINARQALNSRTVEPMRDFLLKIFYSYLKDENSKPKVVGIHKT
jgi:hypothetical protein